jgi:flavin-dependent dehydrogenase
LALSLFADVEAWVVNAIAATITLADASSRRWPVVVVGAGPAGALTARELARRGVAVLLVDRAVFPRRKVCGCCLNVTALAALESAGLGRLPQRLGAIPLTGVKLSAGGSSAVLWLPGGVALSREALDAALVAEAIAAGAAFLPATRASAVQRDVSSIAGTTELELSALGKSIRLTPAVVIAADGLGSPLAAALSGARAVPASASRIGAGAASPSAPGFFTPGTVFMAVGDGGYVGAVRLEDGQLDLASAFDAPFVREHGGMATAAAAILRKTDWPAIDGIEQLPWKGTPPLTRRPPTVAGPGWFAAGDAAGYIEPFTGEGIAWALASALALAPLAAEASVAGSQRAHAAAWRSRHARLLGRRVRRCGIIAACLRRPRMVAAAVRLLGVFPWFARPIVSGLNRSVALKRG